MTAAIATDSTTVIVFLVILGGTPILFLSLLACIWVSRRPPRCSQCTYRHLPIPPRVECPYLRNPPSLLRWFTSSLKRSSDIEVASITSVVPARRFRRARRAGTLDDARTSSRLTAEEMEYWSQETAPPLPVYLERAPAQHEVLIGRDGCTSLAPSYRSPAPSYKSSRSSLDPESIDGAAAPPNSPIFSKTAVAPTSVSSHAEAASGTPLTALPPAVTRKPMRTLQRGRWPSTATI